ncbi:hypothetical protein [Salmonella phage SSBI34]|nr:hypothetical protein [Salmonella phage SSBI34]
MNLLEDIEEREVKLITQKEAANLLDMAYALNRAHPQLRVGQNLWNYIDEDFPELAAKFCSGEYDFFYQRHVPTVIEIFYQHYVEK